MLVQSHSVSPGAVVCAVLVLCGISHCTMFFFVRSASFVKHTLFLEFQALLSTTLNNKKNHVTKEISDSFTSN